ncbi:hypothetical protein ET532_025150 [Verminephrobacter sp. Larva24]|nr:hypothetical protein ET532_025150 [Verminephrobacter sp. Larva24]
MTPQQYVQQKAVASGSSFYYAFLFLPAPRRAAITAFYAFCREVDDVVDSQMIDPGVARTKLAWWQSEVAGGLDVIELHDAFTVEELEYLEAIGVCGHGQAAGLLKEGAFDIGGRCAVSPSGGLIGMGHPIGPTGIGQIVEITRQLRGEAGVRQHPDAQIGLAHMVGLGAVCFAHVLQSL